MITELIFENLNSIELETEVSRFLRIKVKSIKKSISNKRFRAIQILLMIHNWKLSFRRAAYICYIIYFPKEDEGEKK